VKDVLVEVGSQLETVLAEGKARSPLNNNQFVWPLDVVLEELEEFVYLAHNAVQQQRNADDSSAPSGNSYAQLLRGWAAS